MFCVASATILSCGARPPIPGNGKECAVITDVKYKVDDKNNAYYLLLGLADGQTVVIASKKPGPGPYAASPAGGSGSAAPMPPPPPPPSLTDLLALRNCPCDQDLCAPMCGLNLQAFACKAAGP
jgi:hypothetical protein